MIRHVRRLIRLLLFVRVHTRLLITYYYHRTLVRIRLYLFDWYSVYASYGCRHERICRAAGRALNAAQTGSD